jgi:cellulose synthase/poly-beta-1,6-N-acetylglucosamine synthase-like glycosyltransferase
LEEVGALGPKIFNVLKSLESQPAVMLTAGLALVGAVNLIRWQKDKAAAERLAAAEAEPIPGFEQTPKVSFLVPAWNEAEYIQASLASILALRYPNKELVVCAGGNDGSYTIAKQFSGPGVIILEQVPGEGKQGALRRCFEHSTGEIIFQTDADCLVDDITVERTLAPILTEGENVTTGYWQPFDEDKDKPLVAFQWASHLRYQGGMGKYVENLDGRNSAINRETLAQAGAYQNEAAIGTDYVLSRNLSACGYSIRSVLNSRVQTEYPVDIKTYLKQGSRWFRNRLVQGIHYKHWLDVLVSIWAGLSALFILTGLLSFLLHGIALKLLWVLSLFHLGLSQVRSKAFFQRTSSKKNEYNPCFWKFILISLFVNLSIVKGCIESFIPKSKKIW